MVRGLPLLAVLLLAAPAAAEPLQITTSELLNAYVGSSYRWQLTAVGGSLAYSWSALEPEPPGLALSASGVLEGKPTRAGDYVVRVRVRSGADSATASLPLTVIDTAEPLVIVTTTLPPSFVGQSYAAQLVAGGGQPPYTWSLGEDAPSWLVVMNDVLTGTPEEVAEEVTFTIYVTDARDVRVEGQLAIRVVEQLDFRISSGALPDATVGQSYRQVLSAEGGVLPYTFTVENLPMGLAVVAGEDTASIEGTPLESGLFQLDVRALDADLRSAARTMYLNCRAGEVKILTETLPGAEVGEPYAVKLQSEPSQATWSLVSGELPPGLELSDTGEIRGQALGESAGNVYPFLVNATVGGSTGDRALSIAVEVTDPGGGGGGGDDGGGCGCGGGGGGEAGSLGLAAVLVHALWRKRQRPAGNRS